MPKEFSSLTAILALTVFAVCPRAAADSIRWDFAGNLTTLSAVPLSQPGAVPGASITGSMIFPNSDNIAVTPGSPMFPNFLGTDIYSTDASLSLTLNSGGSTYSYTGTFFVIMNNSLLSPGYDVFRFQGNCAGNLELFIEVFVDEQGQIPPDGSLSRCLQGTQTLSPLGGTQLVGLGDGGLINTVFGNLSSLSETVTPVPEPSGIGIGGLFALAHLFRRLRRKRKAL
jgi:hypothetical protein